LGWGLLLRGGKDREKREGGNQLYRGKNGEGEGEREEVYSPNKHKIAKTQWQAAREAKYAYQAGRPYSNITSVTQYIKKKRTNKIHA